MPAAIKSLGAHLGDGDPDAWHAALRVFEQAFGRPAEVEEDQHDPALIDPLGIAALSPLERGQLIARLVRQHPHLAELAGPQPVTNSEG